MSRAIGIDLGGTKIAAGIVEIDGSLHDRAEAPFATGPIEELVGVISRLVEHYDDALPLGIGVAGIVDYEAGRYLYGPNTGFQDLDLVEMLGKALTRPVYMDNDANCAAWAEHRFGAGRGTRHFLCVTLGTGVGGGIVVDGRPYRGARGGAAEIGHVLVDPDGPLCGCGRRGCWEQYASGQALVRAARAGLPGVSSGPLHEWTGGDPAAVTGPMITDAARQGDPFAQSIVDDLGRWIGWGLASLVNILEPERIAIGGGLVREWDLLAPLSRKAMLERVEAPGYRPVPEVVAAQLGPEAGIVGAGLLALQP